MMDYNNVQNALTPQQLARIHATLDGPQADLVAAYGPCAPAVAAFDLRTGLTPVDVKFDPGAGPLILGGSASFNLATFEISIQRLTRRGRPKGPAHVQPFGQTFFDQHLVDATHGGDVALTVPGGWRPGRTYPIGLRVSNDCSTER